MVPFAQAIDIDRACDYAIKGLIERDTLAVIFGPPGSGKSFLAVDLAAHVALGRRWRERRVRKGVVVYVAAEGRRGVRRRLKAWAQHNGISGDIPLVMIQATPNLLDAADVDDLTAEITAEAERHDMPVAMVIIDTLAKSFGGGNENAPDDMGTAIAALDALRDASGAAVVAVHHTGKDASRGARGHNSLLAAVDTAIEVSSDDSGNRSAKLTKQKDGEDGTVIGFRLELVDLGQDADGDPITSCLAVEAGATVRPSHRLRDREKLALEALINMTAIEGEKLPQGSRFPSAGHYLGVKLSGYRREFGNRVMPGHSSDTAGKAFRRTIERLQLIGKIGVYEDWIWPTGQGGQGRTG